MKVLVAGDTTFTKIGDKYYAKNIYGYEFWKRYLQVFDHIHVVSRVTIRKDTDTDVLLPVEGPGITVIELPNIRGVKGAIFERCGFNNAVDRILQEESFDCGIFRLPSLPAMNVLGRFCKKGRPFVIEIVSNPLHAYPPLINWIIAWDLKKKALLANGVSYVTERTLQKMFPSHCRKYGVDPHHFESYYSSINLDADSLCEPKDYTGRLPEYPFILAHTANSINNRKKGHVTLLKVVALLRKQNYDIRVVCIGDGIMLPKLEKLAARLQIIEAVTFTGRISDPCELRNVLNGTDMFVFPTYAEGLPRSIIEAMSVGLPCLSTARDGIPELLKPEYMFSPSDVHGFANKIRTLIHNTDELNAMSKENLETALEYTFERLEKRRTAFYTNLKRKLGVRP